MPYSNAGEVKLNYCRPSSQNQPGVPTVTDVAGVIETALAAETVG